MVCSNILLDTVMRLMDSNQLPVTFELSQMSLGVKFKCLLTGQSWRIYYMSFNIKSWFEKSQELLDPIKDVEPVLYSIFRYCFATSSSL